MPTTYKTNLYFSADAEDPTECILEGIDPAKGQALGSATEGEVRPSDFPIQHPSAGNVCLLRARVI